MQCLYCGKELGLLKELTDGEFCSSQHRQRYRKLAKIALNRLVDPSYSQDASQPPARAAPAAPYQPSRSPGFASPFNGLTVGSGHVQSRQWRDQLLPAGVDFSPGFALRLPGLPEAEFASAVTALEYSSDLQPLAQRREAAVWNVEPVAAPLHAAGQLRPPVFRISPPAASSHLHQADAYISAAYCPAARQIGAVRDESPVRPLIPSAPCVTFPRIGLVEDAGTAVAVPPLAESPVGLLAAAMAARPRPAPVSFQPFSPNIQTVDPFPQGDGSAMASWFESRGPRGAAVTLSPRAQACEIAAMPLAAAEQSFSPAPALSRPSLSAAGQPPELAPAALMALVPRAIRAAESPASEVNELAFAGQPARLPVLGSLVCQPVLRTVEVKAVDTAAAELALEPLRTAGGSALGASAVLPALASLFRFGRPISGAHPLPLLAESVAAQNRPGLPAAYTELPMPVPQMAAMRGSSLRIVETFEYLKPLEDPPFELLRSLVRLWQGAPSYFRFVTVTASVMLLLWASLPRSGMDTLVESRWNKIEDGIRHRATVELDENFQTGMVDWTGEGDWSRTWRLEKAGYVRPGRLALYEPSMSMEGYRVEFLVQVERQSVGWVYRAADAENYYAAKLTVIRPGPLPLLSLVRYPVIAGQAGTRMEIPIRVFLHENTPYRVQLKVNGVEYSTSIEGQLVDFWSDDRFKRGGFGFFGETGSRARVYWMKLSQQDDFVGRVCAYFYPNPVQAITSKESP